MYLQTVVGVRFKKAGKVYYFDPAGLDLAEGEMVIVETARGVEAGEVIKEPQQVNEEEIVAPLKQVLRRATAADLEKLAENERLEQEALAICQEKIAKHNLEMDLVDVDYTFDGSKIMFYFTADGRVDFRELVRDLASVFRTRIELRQIGVRDEAKMRGGIGPCGRELCCATFLRDFEPVSIKMAKQQNLSLNPAKISGICGRLMCCLRFETDSYQQDEGVPCCGCDLEEYEDIHEQEDVFVLAGAQDDGAAEQECSDQENGQQRDNQRRSSSRRGRRRKGANKGS
jgi:cell fate regulator YaaT (PSP1 superfamily)